MITAKKRSVKDSEVTPDLKPIIKSLSQKQKEIIKLLQKNEAIITNKKTIFVTCGREMKKVTLPSFYNLVNRGLVLQQTEYPFRYVLTRTGEIIEV